jgi:CRP/FNR family transcriptional regulator
MTVPIDFLRSIPYFSGLDEGVLEAIRQIAFERRLDKGEIILLEDEPPQALFFVASGAVKVFKTSPDGKEQILSVSRPGDSFNDVAVFDGGTNPASAQTMGPVLVYGIGSEQVDDILRKHPELTKNVIKVLAQRVRQLVALVEDLSFRHVIGRVAKILLEYGGETSTPRPRLTQQEIAAMAGTAREVVGRSLKTLEEDSIIRLERHRVVINDKEALRQMAAEPS